MRINKLDHFNIIANAGDIKRVIKFYTELLGFTEGPRPDFGFTGAWLYWGEFPLIHLSVIQGPDLQRPGLDDTTTGCVHHIAFDCEGLDEFKALLDENGIKYLHTGVPEWNIEQLFLHDPSGTRIELNFKNG